jgi:predicted nucleic acid-binding protein
MVTDASFWVSSLHKDIHTQPTLAWLKNFSRTGDHLFAPNLLFAEVAGAVARQTGRSRFGHTALTRLRKYTFLQIVPLDEQLSSLAAEMAAECRLRGADAVYAALAYTLNVPLLTWDQEQITRVQKVVKAGIPGTLFGSNGHDDTRSTPPNDPI